MRRPAHTTVAAYVALFLALGATAWAAATVGSDDVVNNSLKSADLKNNGGVKTADVRNRSLGGADVGNGSLRGGDFGTNSIGGADTDESTMSVTRIAHSLGGPVNQQVNNSLAFKLIPNNAFTQGPTESDQIVGFNQVTFPAGCTQPRQFLAYLLLDDPTVSGSSIIAIAQLADSGAGAVTRTVSFAPAPFGGASTLLLRSGAARPHSLFVHAAGSCSAGAGITLDSVDLKVIGHR